ENVLKHLPAATNAPFNSQARQHEPICHPDTRVNLLQDIDRWVDGEDECSLFWLSGMAGTGKSTIARTIARRHYDQGKLGASFFFSRGGGDVGNASKFVTSIAIQLASSEHAICQTIYDTVTKNSNIINLSLHDQWRMLVLASLSKLAADVNRTSFFIAVDALDECDDDRDVRTIIQLFADAGALKAARLRIFLTSRPEIPIRLGFSQIPDSAHQDFILHNISRSIVDRDIFVFLEYTLKLIAQQRSMPLEWPGKEAVSRMVQTASGLFIWAATACIFIQEGKRFAAKRLDMILKGSGGGNVMGPAKHLDEIYITVLANSISQEYTEEEKEEAYHMLRQILGTIAVLSSPLSVSSLTRLLGLVKEDVCQTLEDLHSVLDISNNENQPLRLHHPSFRDFLLDENRSKSSKFWVEDKQMHQVLAHRCLQVMSSALRQNICSFELPGQRAADVDNVLLEQYLPSEVQYACLYWVQHLQKSEVNPVENDQVHQFLNEHLLHWLEALGWMRKVHDGVQQCPLLYTFVYDMKRFSLYCRPAIEKAPLQVYSSALVFAPARSVVRRQFEGKIPKWIQMTPTMPDQWDAALVTLEGHQRSVNSLAFSSDGKRLVSGSCDGVIKLWDSDSGELRTTIEAHSDSDGIRPWFKGHFPNSVNSVVFSPDDKRIASCSENGTVKIWDADSGKLWAMFKVRGYAANDVAFSPDGNLLALGSSEVELWDVESCKLLVELGGHDGSVKSVAFSPDGKQIASGTYCGDVKLWYTESRGVKATLMGHKSSYPIVTCVTFSPDGEQLASGTSDGFVKLWNSNSGELLASATFQGHTGVKSCLGFLPDGSKLLAPGTGSTVLLDAQSGSLQRTHTVCSTRADSIAISRDYKLASCLNDYIIKLWDLELCQPWPAPRDDNIEHGRITYVDSVAISPDGKWLASGFGTGDVLIFDAQSGKRQITIAAHNNERASAVAFSPDSKWLASGAHDNLIKLWEVKSGMLRGTLSSHTGHVYSVKFSLDGKQLASGSKDGTAKLWDVESQTLQVTLRGHEEFVEAVAFSPNGEQLATGALDGTVKLWDCKHYKELQSLKQERAIFYVAFSADGSYLISNTGIIRPELGMPTTPEQPDLLVSNDWVMLGSQRLLWLPKEYRSIHFAVEGQNLVIGRISGQKPGRLNHYRFACDKMS
ncbi:putative WD-repeat protein, partial [Leptodontidium sp. 2 PMI_412]